MARWCVPLSRSGACEMRPEVAVRQLLSDFALEDSYPIDVEALANSLGAVVVYRGLKGNVSGAPHRDTTSGDTLIGVNGLHPPSRMRFTIAHQLHALLHKGRPIIVDREIRVNL